MFTDVFLTTTNPTLSIDQFFQGKIISKIALSIIFHTIIYTVFFNVISFVFFGKMLSNKINQRLLICALLIMTGGYLARFYHVKEIYNAYNHDEKRTREHINHLFITWLFVG
jgi:hypothetical protein